MIRPSALPLVLVLFVACIGDDPPSGSSGSSGEIDGGGSGDASGGGDGDSGAARSITCDSKSSCKGTQKCCGVGTDWINASCKDDCSGAYELMCDDATDCGTDRVCCFVSDGGARVTKSYCKAACAGLEGQLCNPSAELNECATPSSCTPFMNWSPSGLSRCQ